MTDITYEAVRYAADGNAGEQDPLGDSDGEVIESGTIDECRAAIRRRLGKYMDDPSCPWDPDREGEVEAYNESAEDFCGGYVIRVQAA